MTIETLLRWLDHHPRAHPIGATVVIVAALIAVLVPLLRPGPEDDRRPDWRWGAMIAAILLVGRWPSLLVHSEFNVDEGHLMTGAFSLLRDPVAWRAVDGTTSGPLNFLALWPAGMLLGWQDYLSARLTALALFSIIFTLLHQVLARTLGFRVARAASLPALVLESLTNSFDLLHFSSELPAMAMLAAAAYAGVRRWKDQGGPGWAFLGGLMLGAAPWAKIQILPLAAPLGLAWLAMEFFPAQRGPQRHKFYLVLGAIVPTALLIFQVVLAGVWRDALISYILQNVYYVDTRYYPWHESLRRALGFSIFDDSLLHFWLPASLAACMLMMLGRQRETPWSPRWLLAAAAACALATCCVLTPGRAFLHYWQFLVGPLTVFVAVTMAAVVRTAPALSRSRWLVAGCVLLMVGPMVVQRNLARNYFVGRLEYFHTHRQTPLAARVARIAHPGDTLAVWGWTTSLYVETGLACPVRDTHFAIAVTPGPYSGYFQARFFRDVLGTQPTLFVDSAGPFSLIFNSEQYEHQRIVPELGRYIASHYDLVDSLYGARIYRLKNSAR